MRYVPVRKHSMLQNSDPFMLPNVIHSHVSAVFFFTHRSLHLYPGLSDLPPPTHVSSLCTFIAILVLTHSCICATTNLVSCQPSTSTILYVIAPGSSCMPCFAKAYQEVPCTMIASYLMCVPQRVESSSHCGEPGHGQRIIVTCYIPTRRCWLVIRMA